MDSTAGYDFLDFVTKKVHINMCSVLEVYIVTAAWILEQKIRIIKNKRDKIINEHNKL